ncbi:hypothetical protein THAOC_36818, partial [Thalassiosira oceanica]
QRAAEKHHEWGDSLSGRAGRDNFLRDWSRVKQSPPGVYEQRGIPAKIESLNADHRRPPPTMKLEANNPPRRVRAIWCWIVRQPLPDFGKSVRVAHHTNPPDPYGPPYLQIGSLGQCLAIGRAAGAQNVEHPRSRVITAPRATCHACPEGGSMKLQACKRNH